MNDLLVGLLSALVATNPPAAVSNLVKEKTGLEIPIANPNDPVEQAYLRIVAEDDATLIEIERWREESHKSGLKPNTVETSLLENRIRKRVAPVRTAYEEFLQKNPKHTNARVAYAAFLDEVGDEEEATRQLEKAVELDPKSPAALNNLANHYGHGGQVQKAFPLYERAVAASPAEPLYYDNLATTVFLFRPDAMEHYKITEQEVFAKALGLYRRAIELDPSNFDRAVEFAKNYYGVKPAPATDPEGRKRAGLKLAEEALAAWQAAYKLAADEAEREGVRLHFARWQISAGRFDEARASLNAITNATFTETKRRLVKKLADQAAKAADDGPAARP